MRVLYQADACSPLRDDFARALDVRREVRVTPPAPPARRALSSASISLRRW